MLTSVPNGNNNFGAFHDVSHDWAGGILVSEWDTVSYLNVA